jgi:hypothetical protein
VELFNCKPDGSHCNNKAVNGAVEGRVCHSSYSEDVTFESQPEIGYLDCDVFFSLGFFPQMPEQLLRIKH